MRVAGTVRKLLQLAGDSDKDMIVLADFDTKTGDPVFDDTLRQGWPCSLSNRRFSA
jgi:hypothetical protein